MLSEHVVFLMFIIFGGAVIFSTFAITIRQPLLIAYIFLGLVMGPYGAKLVPEASVIAGIGEIGIVFLLFLVGVDLDMRELYQSLRKVSLVTVSASLIVAIAGGCVAYLLNYSFFDTLIISGCMIFSSTVVALKLMTKNELFHTVRGEIMISILLFQDLLAIVVLFLLESLRGDGLLTWQDAATASLGFPALWLIAFLGSKYLIQPLASRFWPIEEYTFLLSIAWCVSLAELADRLGLSYSIGAFIAGVSIASSSKIASIMRSRLNPIRDFFLLLFFFSIGAGFNYHVLEVVLLPGILFCLIIVLLKPVAYGFLFRTQGVPKKDAWQVGMRLGLGSEFSLLIATLASAFSPRLISIRAEYTIQLMTVLSFIMSSFYIAWRYHKPSKTETTI